MKLLYRLLSSSVVTSTQPTDHFTSCNLVYIDNNCNVSCAVLEDVGFKQKEILLESIVALGNVVLLIRIWWKNKENIKEFYTVTFSFSFLSFWQSSFVIPYSVFYFELSSFLKWWVSLEENWLFLKVAPNLKQRPKLIFYGWKEN